MRVQQPYDRSWDNALPRETWGGLNGDGISGARRMGQQWHRICAPETTLLLTLPAPPRHQHHCPTCLVRASLQRCWEGTRGTTRPRRSRHYRHGAQHDLSVGNEGVTKPNQPSSPVIFIHFRKPLFHDNVRARLMSESMKGMCTCGLAACVCTYRHLLSLCMRGVCSCIAQVLKQCFQLIAIDGARA